MISYPQCTVTYSPSLRSSTPHTTASTDDMSISASDDTWTTISDDTNDADSGNVGSSTGTAGSEGGTISTWGSIKSTAPSLVSASWGDLSDPGGVVSRLITVLNWTVSDSTTGLSSVFSDVSWIVYRKISNSKTCNAWQFL